MYASLSRHSELTIFSDETVELLISLSVWILFFGRSEYFNYWRKGLHLRVRGDHQYFQRPSHVRAVYLGPPFSCHAPFMQSRVRWSAHTVACRLNAATAAIIIAIKANCRSVAWRLHARIPAVCCSYLLKHAPTGGTKTQSLSESMPEEFCTLHSSSWQYLYFTGSLIPVVLM